MKKEDLRSGMIVQTRQGGFGMILLNTTNGDIIGGGTHTFNHNERLWKPLENLSDDLTSREYGNDIVKIYNANANYIFGTFDTKLLTCIWERPVTPIEMTMDEIANKLGIDVDRLKIIK
jgi:hypothetical protein